MSAARCCATCRRTLAEGRAGTGLRCPRHGAAECWLVLGAAGEVLGYGEPDGVGLGPALQPAEILRAVHAAEARRRPARAA